KRSEGRPARRGGRAGTWWKEGRWEDAGLGQAPGERPPTVAQRVRRRGGVERSDRVRRLECVMSGVKDARSFVTSPYAPSDSAKSMPRRARGDALRHAAHRRDDAR